MSKRMKGFTCCGDCIYYNYKKHKCNLGASIETDAIEPFYDDCPIPDIPSEQEIRSKAIEDMKAKLYEKANWIEQYTHAFGNIGNNFRELIDKAAEQMKEENNG